MPYRTRWNDLDNHALSIIEISTSDLICQNTIVEYGERGATSRRRKKGGASTDLSIFEALPTAAVGLGFAAVDECRNFTCSFIYCCDSYMIVAREAITGMIGDMSLTRSTRYLLSDWSL